MKTCVVAIILTASFLLIKSEVREIRIEPRILGGVRARAGQFPWQVLLRARTLKWTLTCGGSLIGHEWVLTAAHCLEGVGNLALHFGGVTTDTAEVVIGESLRVVHPEYNTDTVNNDIALVRLSRPIKYTSTIKAVALPSANKRIGANVPVTVSGYGRIQENTPNNKFLYYVNLTTIENSECARIYRKGLIISSTLCAKGGPQHNTCSGDSGGPVVHYDEKGVATLVAVVSFVSSMGCGANSPAGFVRTASYVDWIREITAV